MLAGAVIAQVLFRQPNHLDCKLDVFSVKGYAPRYVSPDSAGKDTCIAINPTELSLIFSTHIRMKDDAKLSKVFYDLHMCTLISEPIHIINTHTHTHTHL